MSIKEIEIGDNVFWVLINFITFGCTAILIFATANYHSNANETIERLIKEGYDPVAVKCAIEDTYGNQPTCIVLAAKLKQSN